MSYSVYLFVISEEFLNQQMVSFLGGWIIYFSKNHFLSSFPPAYPAHLGWAKLRHHILEPKCYGRAKVFD